MCLSYGDVCAAMTRAEDGELSGKNGLLYFKVGLF